MKPLDLARGEVLDLRTKVLRHNNQHIGYVLVVVNSNGLAAEFAEVRHNTIVPLLVRERESTDEGAEKHFEKLPEHYPRSTYREVYQGW